MVAIASHARVLADELTNPERDVLGKSWERMAICANQLTVATYFDTDPPHQRLVDARFCGLSVLCPVCAKRRGYLAATRYHPRIVESLAAHKDSVLAMITLTLENQACLRSGLELLRDAWKNRMEAARRYRNKPDRHPHTEFVKILGCVRSFEVKRAKDQRFWHPHLHGACILSEYIDRHALSEEWRKATGGAFIVHVRRIDNLEKGLKEVLKYPCKFEDLSAEDHVRIWSAFRGIPQEKRILSMSSTGCLRGVQFNEDGLDPDEPPSVLPRLLDKWIWTNDRKYESGGSVWESPEEQEARRAAREAEPQGIPLSELMAAPGRFYDLVTA